MNRRSGFSLLELTAVIAVVLLGIALTGKLFADACVSIRDALEEAENSRLIGVVVRRWPQAFRDTRATDWKISGNTFVTGKVTIEQEDDALVFHDESGSGAVYLPHAFRCEFSIEQHNTGADCAVLVIHSESRRLGRILTNKVRVVACGR